MATAAKNLANGGANTRGTIVDGLLNGHRPLIVVRDSATDGHVVVAYDVRADTAPGAYLIDVYDPNVPFTAEETTAPNTHVARMETSVIHVGANGHWSHVGGYGRTWSGGPGTLVAVPWGTVPRTPTLPSTLSGLVSLIVPFASGTAPAQVVDAAGRTLLDAQGRPNADPATRIPGSDVLPSLSGPKGRPISIVPAAGSYTTSLPATASGTTGLGVIAPGFSATVRGVRTGSGATNRVEVDGAAGGLTVEAARGGDLEATLARAASGTPYGADLTVRGGDPGVHAFALAAGGGAAGYRNGGGAATVAIRLRGSNSRGIPGVVDLGSVPVPRGGTLTVAPSRWSDVATRGARVTVRSASGRVLVAADDPPEGRREAHPLGQGRRANGVRQQPHRHRPRAVLARPAGLAGRRRRPRDAGSHRRRDEHAHDLGREGARAAHRQLPHEAAGRHLLRAWVGRRRRRRDERACRAPHAHPAVPGALIATAPDQSGGVGR